ncbi:MAG: hypothetical protein MJ181_10135 [Treponema sp.]|nr:hypothetical protein [Treponema sp.]
MIDLNKMSLQALEIANARNIEPVTVMNMIKHCAGEVVEASESYSKTDFQDKFLLSEKYKDFISEMSDVIMCILIVAGLEEIDIEQALRNCLKKNKARIKGEK